MKRHRIATVMITVTLPVELYERVLAAAARAEGDSELADIIAATPRADGTVEVSYSIGRQAHRRILAAMKRNHATMSAVVAEVIKRGLDTKGIPI